MNRINRMTVCCHPVDPVHPVNWSPTRRDMPRALWLLFGLQVRGWLRFAKRNASSVRGLLFLLVGLFVSGMWIVSMLFNASTSPNQPSPEQLDRFGPIGLLGMCL